LTQTDAGAARSAARAGAAAIVANSQHRRFSTDWHTAMSSSKQQTYSKGLVGVIAGTTSTCDVGPGGHGLFYRGAHSRHACINSHACLRPQTAAVVWLHTTFICDTYIFQPRRIYSIAPLQATTFRTWQQIAFSRRSPSCLCMATCPPPRSSKRTTTHEQLFQLSVRVVANACILPYMMLLIPRYCAKLSALRELPAALRTVLELVPKNAHPMDVMRTGACVLCWILNNESRCPNQRIARRAGTVPLSYVDRPMPCSRYLQAALCSALFAPRVRTARPPPTGVCRSMTCLTRCWPRLATSCCTGSLNSR
jgi:hypothetical protein